MIAKDANNEATNQIISDIAGYVETAAADLHHYITNGQYERLRYTAEYLEASLDRSDKILDIGSFPYFLPAYLSLKGFNNISTVEIPRVDDFPLCPSWNFTSIRLDIEEAPLPLEDNSFDAILLLEVFEHLYRRPNQVFRELRRVLKPDGKLVISTPNGGQLQTYVKALFRKQFGPKIYEWSEVYERLGHFAHIREYSLQEIEEYLENFDFRTEEASRLSFYQLDNPYTGGMKRLLYSTYRAISKLLPFVPIIQNNIFVVARNRKSESMPDASKSSR